MSNEEIKASREKYWNECDSETKIERLRQEIKGLQREVSMLMRVTRLLQSHSHTPDGSTVVPIREKDEPCPTEYYSTRVYEKDTEVYF